MKFPTLDSSNQGNNCKTGKGARVWNECKRSISLHYSQPHQFALTQWQSSPRPTTGYLIYRWILFLGLISVTVASFACQSLPKNYKGPPIKLNYFKWFIYFTNWGFLMLIIQSGLALAVVHRFRTERNISSQLTEEGGIQHRNRKTTPLVCQLYWLSHNVATDLAFIITFVYWLLVHDPEVNELNALNVLVHGFNSGVVLLELSVTSHPIRCAHGVYSIGVGLLYGVFSALYYSVGGTDRAGGTEIYPCLDWNSPGGALIFVALCGVILSGSHALVTGLAFLRQKLARRLCKQISSPDSLNPTDEQ